MTHHVVDQIQQGSQTIFLYSTMNAEESAQTAALVWSVRWSERRPVVDYAVPGILQDRILEWVAFPFSRGSSQPRDRTQVSCRADSLPAEPPRKSLGVCKQNYLLFSNCFTQFLLGRGVTSAPRDNHYCPCTSLHPFKRRGSLLFFLICLPTAKDGRLNDQGYVTTIHDQIGMKTWFSKCITCYKHSGQRHIIESFAFLSISSHSMGISPNIHLADPHLFY